MTNMPATDVGTPETPAQEDGSPLVEGLPDQTNPLLRTAELPVSEHAIRVWCDAIGESNPIYHDDSAARRVGLPGVIAPSAMLQTWTAPVSAVQRRLSPTLHSQVRARAREAGFAHVVATNYAQEYLRPVRPGDLLTERSWIHNVTPIKHTALGPGCFVDIAMEIRDGEQPVGRLRSRTLYFDPSRSGEFRAPRSGGSDAAEAESDWLEPLEVPLDRTTIIAGALASNDHEKVHIDHELARSQGLPDIIVSIVTTTGLVLRYFGERGSVDTRCRAVSLRLARPTFPGDVLTLKGRGEARNNGGFLVVGEHSRGRHVAARLQLHH